MIVVDSNVVAARVLRTRLTALAIEVEERDPVWVVPPLWRYEFQSILVKTAWSGDLSPEGAQRAWRTAWRQLAENEREPDPEQTVDMGIRHRVSAYDASSIALALALDARCVTEDRELQAKFPEVALGMRAFLDLEPA